MIRTAIAIGILVGMVAGCGDNETSPGCQPVPDGYYVSQDGTGYTFQNGFPVGFQNWSCTESSCGSYTCSNAGQTVTIEISYTDGTVNLTISGVHERLRDACRVPTTSNTSYGDCHSKMADGTECVTSCGQLPQDGTPGTTLAVGCRVQIGTSMPAIGTCVNSCSECP